MSKFYFAVKDGAYDPETGIHEEAGMSVEVTGDLDEDIISFVERHYPVYAGRLRPLTEEEYMRDYGD